MEIAVNADKKKLLITGAILLLICLVTAAMLGVVNELTKEPIAKNKLELQTQALAALFPGLAQEEGVRPLEGERAKGIGDIFQIYDEEGNLLGYAVESSVGGFKSTITLIVGISPEFVLTGVKITDFAETAGIGTKVNNEDYLKGYAGLSGKVAFGDGINAMAGATVTSKAVLKAVNSALENIASILGESGVRQNEETTNNDMFVLKGFQ